MRNIKPIYNIGYRCQAVTGESFEVIKYEGRKKITIRFDCGMEKNTTSTLIKQNKVKYVKKVNKYSIGDVFYNKEDVKAEIVGIDKEKGRVDLRFENGNIKNYSLSSLGTRSFTDEDLVKIKIGDVFQTNGSGEVKVVEYINAHKVVVEFSDGSKTTCQAEQLRDGRVRHPTSGIKTGYIFTNNEGFRAKVLDYISPFKVTIEWEEGGITEAMASNIKSGGVYYPNQKTVCGVGYFGIGKYKPNRSGRGQDNYKQRVYDSWQRMIRRCYDEKEQQKPSCRAYRGVKVCEEWHNFQNFASWAEDKLEKFEEGWELDKDMFGNGLLYSPENCTLLPYRINWFLSDSYSNKVSGLPEGVTKIEPNADCPNGKVGFVARCSIKGVREYLGFYNTPKEAGQVYREAKENEAKRLAEEYRHLLTEEQYERLANFKLENIHRKPR